MPSFCHSPAFAWFFGLLGTSLIKPQNSGLRCAYEWVLVTPAPNRFLPSTIQFNHYFWKYHRRTSFWTWISCDIFVYQSRCETNINSREFNSSVSFENDAIFNDDVQITPATWLMDSLVSLLNLPQHSRKRMFFYQKSCHHQIGASVVFSPFYSVFPRRKKQKNLQVDMLLSHKRST